MAETAIAPATPPATVPASLQDRISEFLARLADLLRNARVLLPLQCLALWPVWQWYAARVRDGSDDSPGPLALGLALLLLYGRRREFRAEPRTLPLLAAGLLSLVQAMATDWPHLLRALLGTLAIGGCLAALLRRPRDAAPLWLLLALSLPLVSSLQFYGGYPLRLLAAEGAGLLLRLAGLPVVAEGAGLRWGGGLVLVDAPCSGVHMLWVALVMAGAASAVAGAGPLRLLCNSGLAVLLVVAGNILRNAALFMKESGLIDLPAWTHDAIGVAAFVLIVVPLALVSLRRSVAEPWPEACSSPRHRPGAIGAAVLLFAVATVWSVFRTSPAAPPEHESDPRWPTRFQGRELIRLPLAAAETGWLRGFPGAAARFTDGEREILIRRVGRPTRMLHPAADCFRGLGYAVTPTEVRMSAGKRWSCFTVRRDGASREVCERIQDEHGHSWSDASSWYWSALLNHHRGPWWALTVAGTTQSE